MILVWSQTAKFECESQFLASIANQKLRNISVLQQHITSARLGTMFNYFKQRGRLKKLGLISLCVTGLGGVTYASLDRQRQRSTLTHLGGVKRFLRWVIAVSWRLSCKYTEDGYLCTCSTENTPDISGVKELPEVTSWSIILDTETSNFQLPFRQKYIW